MKEKIIEELEKVSDEKYLNYVYELLLTFNEEQKENV